MVTTSDEIWKACRDGDELALQDVFKTFAGKHGVLLKVFQKNWKILKRAFDKCKNAWYVKWSC